jgi:hypothetical protein
MAVASVKWPRAHSTIAPFVVDWEALAVLCPEIAAHPGSDSISHAPWDDVALQEWFLGLGIAPTESFGVLEPRWWSRRPRRRRRAGWSFGNGSTWTTGEGWPRSIGILADGRRVYGLSTYASLEPACENEGFNADVLCGMARRANLASLPMCPTPPALILA